MGDVLTQCNDVTSFCGRSLVLALLSVLVQCGLMTD